MTVVLKRPARNQGSYEEEEKALEERKGSKVKKRILTLVSGIQRKEEQRRTEKKRNLITSLNPRFSLL